MKVGDYVRTNGEIGKLINCPEQLKKEYGNWLWFETIDEQRPIRKEDIVKSSPHIIDLIEVGDYVNGEKVGCIDDCKGAMREFYYYYENPNDVVGHWEEEIKTIVTKDQFSQIEYRIEE